MLIGVILVIINLCKILAGFGYLSDTLVSKFDKVFMKYCLHTLYLSIIIDLVFLNITISSFSSVETVKNPISELYDVNSNFSQFDLDSSKTEEQKIASKKEENMDKNKTEHDFSITLYGLLLCSVCVIYMIIIGE
jgi:hypothetical protein